MDEKKPIFASVDDIQAKLDKKLGPEYISKRVGFGTNQVAYIEGWRAINLANQIFGYNGWSTEVRSVTVDFLDERQGRYSIGCTAIVRVTLTSGTYREDIGYGTVENERRKAAAFERAKKSAVTDALKRALRGFGNALGNCLYDKDFLSKIDKVKFDPPDFDEGNLFRPSDEISEMSRSGTHDPDSQRQGSPKRRQLTRVGNHHSSNVKTEDKYIRAPSYTSDPMSHRHTYADGVRRSVSLGQPQNQQGNQQRNTNSNVSKDLQKHPGNANLNSGSNNIGSDLKKPERDVHDQDDMLDDSFMFSDDFQDDDLINMGYERQEERSLSTNQNTTVNEPVKFVTAKAAVSLQNNDKIAEENLFDPKYKSQSFKPTVDQSTSKHIPASVVKSANVSGSRDIIYKKFPPKGKQLDMPSPGANDVPSNGSRPPPASETAQGIPEKPTTTVANPQPENKIKEPPINRFAPPLSVVHPNSNAYMASINRPVRREVGRPKINPPNIRRADP